MPSLFFRRQSVPWSQPNTGASHLVCALPLLQESGIGRGSTTLCGRTKGDLCTSVRAGTPGQICPFIFHTPVQHFRVWIITSINPQEDEPASVCCQGCYVRLLSGLFCFLHFPPYRTTHMSLFLRISSLGLKPGRSLSTMFVAACC